MAEREVYDYVVVGAGSAGAVVAARLTEDAAIRVLLLEAGGPAEADHISIPAAFANLFQTRWDWNYQTAEQKQLHGRRAYWPRMKALGGCSSMNAMIYIRGNRLDYDTWRDAYGAVGWGYDDVLPAFVRAEGNTRLGAPFHGQDGPLHVEDRRYTHPLTHAWVDSAVAAGFTHTDDFNGAEQEGVGIYQVTQKDGERWSAARAYLFPHMGKRANLHVETHAQVARILVEDGRAVGVEAIKGKERRTVRARREVVLSAGALQSPQILMLSGIGPAAELKRHGIAPVLDLPGVGRNLQDHPDFIFGYRSASLDTFGISLSGGWRMLRETLRYPPERRGAITSNFAEAGGFLKTRPDLDAPDIQLHFIVSMVDDHARRLHLGHGFSCHVCLLRPRSRGTLTLASADPLAAPLIDPAFLMDPQDVEDMVAGFRLTRRLMEAPALAAWVRKDMVTAEVRSDDDIRAVLRRRVDTVYHPVGTCRMGMDADAVVDPELRVRGIEGLRVVDASIMPTLIGGNTNAPVIMIAEKAVDMMRGTSRV